MARSIHEALTAADLRCGQCFQTERMILTLEDALGFARKYDPQPMHVDPAAAEGSVFGQLIASGWHVMASTMRLVVDMRPFGTTPLIGAEITRIRFRRPVIPGTEILARVTVGRIELHMGGGKAYAHLAVETVDAVSDEVLVTQDWKMLLPGGDKGAPA